MKKIIFVAGPPGSGKTEFIKQSYLNKYKVFDLDNYRKKNKELSISNPLSYSESTTENAGLLMCKDINKSLSNDSTIVIETTFSSLNNTLEQIKNSDYEIFAFLFVVNEIEFYLSSMERFMHSYAKGENCRLISFEKYLSKLKFYEEYIDIIKNYGINISYITRNANNIKFYNDYPMDDIKYNIEYYLDRINLIKEFGNQKKIEELLTELNKMFQFYKKHDRMRKVIK